MHVGVVVLKSPISAPAVAPPDPSGPPNRRILLEPGRSTEAKDSPRPPPVVTADAAQPLVSGLKSCVRARFVQAIFPLRKRWRRG
jgi:hypothetical protein